MVLENAMSFFIFVCLHLCSILGNCFSPSATNNKDFGDTLLMSVLKLPIVLDIEIKAHVRWP